MGSRKVILDCDPGIDDALALLLAMASPELEVLVVTTVVGNVSLQRCTLNALKVLQIACSKAPPQVRPGASQPLRGCPGEGALQVHGEDGLGNLHLYRDGETLRYPDPKPLPPSAPAHLLLPQLARRYPGEVSLIATGPLTNLALALQQDPDGMRCLAEVIVMGGAFRVSGNVTPAAEFNIWFDPEAAFAVLTSGLPLTMVGLDVTQQVLLTPEDVASLPADPSPSRLVRDCTPHYLRFHQEKRGLAGAFLHDPLAVGVAIDPEFVSTEMAAVEVVTREGPERGRTVLIPHEGRSRGPIRVCVQVEAQRFLRFFLDRVGQQSPGQAGRQGA